MQVRKAVRKDFINICIRERRVKQKSHCYADEEHGNGHQKNMRRVCEYTCDFVPTEQLSIFAISVGITTPIIGKVSAICIALLLIEKPKISGRGRDETECSQPNGRGKGSLLNEPVKDT
jgi:hypothetical protein